MSGTEIEERRGIQSIDFVGQLLEAMARADAALSLKRLSEETGVPAAKLHRYLASLVRIGLARQNPADARYDLGPLAIRLGLAAMARRDAIGLAEAALNRVLDRHGLTGHLSVWSDHGPVIVRTHHGGRPLITSLGLGRVLPLTRSATGLVFASFLPDSATAALILREIASPEERTALQAMIDQTRAQRIGFVDGTVIPGLAALSVPVFDFDGSLVCALTATGLAGSFGTDGRQSAIAAELAAASDLNS
ncbi:IclR family transcriptional regulator [Paracoccus sp. 11-3]|uniref:IclR family transcriptional regulator n=1 Tax=Paracoccus amoyensis TaxID=2760093 RepID=A0A926GHQ5_9RHOB|nr:IclR family transcriptional regulator [Paracoccus amoyensis]MBC9247484.1 IclR family transcriptional regulator [Paracoccus amoyensis]